MTLKGPLYPLLYYDFGTKNGLLKDRKSPFEAPLGLPFESTYLILIYICHVVKQKKNKNKINDTIIYDFKGFFSFNNEAQMGYQSHLLFK